MIAALLSSPLLLLATFASGVELFFNPAAVVHSCVNVTSDETLPPGVPQHLVDVDTTHSEQTMLLRPLTPETTTGGGGDDQEASTMCVLHRWTRPLADRAAGRGYYYPLGRSDPTVPAEVYPDVDDPIVPHGRASRGYGDWNRPPGRAGRQGGIEYACGTAGNAGANFAAGEYICEVTLPTTSTPNRMDPTITDPNDAPYFLTYYRRSVTVRNEISRFLQKNTFGPTAAEIDDLEAAYYAALVGADYEAGDAVSGGGGDGSANETSDAADDLTDVGSRNEASNSTSDPTVDEISAGTGNETANATANARRLQAAPAPGNLTHAEAMFRLQLDWVVRQMDPSTFTSSEFSSLRRYWRRRLNPRKEETYRIGESGPGPCEKNSRWRRFAFTSFDVQNSKMLRWGNQDIGGSYQTQLGHKVTVERVVYEAPVAATMNATGAPTASPVTMGVREILPTYDEQPSNDLLTCNEQVIDFVVVDSQ